MILFRSKAGADVLMLQVHADAVLAALGREPAAEGIFLPERIEAALSHFQAQDEIRPKTQADDEDEPEQSAIPNLAQRAWPVLDLLRRAQAMDVAVTWSSA